jgi:twinkle protein
VLIKHGAAVLTTIVENAKRWPLDGIIGMDKIFPTVIDWYENGYPVGASCKVPGFDQLLKFSPGEITTITGIPGHGKDEFFNWVMAKLAIHEDAKFGMCGFEEVPAITTTKLAEKLTD